MTHSQRFKVNPALMVEKFDNEVLLYDVSSTKGLYLNETAFLIWEMCSWDYPVGEIITTLEKVYPKEHESIREDVMECIESLVVTGVLTDGNS